MKNRVALKLSLSRALLLAVAAIAALGGPIIMGIANVKAGGAQSEPAVRSVASPIDIVEERPLSPQPVQLEGPRSAPAKIPTAPQASRRWATRPGATNSWSTSGAIQEYRVGEIKVTGAKLLPNDLIRSLLGLVSGEVFDESRLRKGFEQLKKFYGISGYVNFTPVPALDFDEQRKVVNLTVNIDEGRQFIVNRIRITGNRRTTSDFILREILVKEGEVFNSSFLELSLLRLNQLGLFEEIKIEDAAIKPSPSEPKLDIDLTVKEKER